MKKRIEIILEGEPVDIEKFRRAVLEGLKCTNLSASVSYPEDLETETDKILKDKKLMKLIRDARKKERKVVNLVPINLYHKLQELAVRLKYYADIIL